MFGRNFYFENVLFGSVLMVAETGVPVENNKPFSLFTSSSSEAEFELTNITDYLKTWKEKGRDVI
jgi:hypothetical protein